MSSLRSSNSFSSKEHKKRSLRGSFLKARRGTVCRELKWALLSAAQPQSALRGHHTHRARPPAPRSLARRQPAIFLVHGGSTSRLLCAKPAAPPQLGENEHDGRHVPVESHVVITTDTHPIHSRARGAGWVTWFGLPLRERPPASVGSANKHEDAPRRSRPCLDHRDRPLALVQPGIHAASSEAGARRHRRYSHASTGSFSAAKGPAFLQNFQLRGASIFRYPLVTSIWRSGISPQVPFMSHH